MVQFKVPTTNHWSNYVGTVESKVPGLTKEQILTEYKDVFTGLGRLKVEPIKIHLKGGCQTLQETLQENANCHEAEIQG